MDENENCTNCDWSRMHGKMFRYYDLHTRKWRIWRRCSWCGFHFPTTIQEWNRENPDRCIMVVERGGNDE